MDYLNFGHLKKLPHGCPKWADTKVTSQVSKMRGGGRGHFWTMSKRKTLFFLMASLRLQRAATKSSCPTRKGQKRCSQGQNRDSQGQNRDNQVQNRDSQGQNRDNQGQNRDRDRDRGIIGQTPIFPTFLNYNYE